MDNLSEIRRCVLYKLKKNPTTSSQAATVAQLHCVVDVELESNSATVAEKVLFPLLLTNLRSPLMSAARQAKTPIIISWEAAVKRGGCRTNLPVRQNYKTIPHLNRFQHVVLCQSCKF